MAGSFRVMVSSRATSPPEPQPTGQSRGGGWAGASLGGGGFAAKGGTLVVDLNGGTGTVTWGASGSDFLQDTTTGEQSSQALVFGSNSSDSQVNFQNGIALGATNPSYYREIYVSSGTGTDSALISGTISDT